MHIVADIGGTKMRVAASSNLKSFGEPVITKTPREYDSGITELIETIRHLRGSSQIESIVIGIAGALSEDKRYLVGAHHLPFWRNRPFAEDLEKELGSKVHIENDTALVGLGEAVFGAGKGSPIVVYITVSTGVNGVRIVDGRIDRSTMGFEIGGQYLLLGSAPKTLEDLISGSALTEKYGVQPREIEKDSPVWQDLAELTAIGVHNTILHWSPGKVVLGGSMFNDIGIPVPRVEEIVKDIMRKFKTVPPIVHSKLGDLGGLYGGMAYTRNRNLG